jgi:glycosyltransferase involved in cell wall biosynthesis
MNNSDKSLKKEYDICLLSISDISSDARTLNIAKTLAKTGKSLAIIAFGKDEDKIFLKNLNIDFYGFNFDTPTRAYQRWKIFNKEVKKYSDIKAKTYWAADFFSLSATNKFSKKYKAPFYYDSREIYSRIGSLNQSPLRQFIQSELEILWVKNVSKIIVSGELDAEYLKNHFKLNVPYHVIMNLPPYKEKLNSDLFRAKYSIPKEQKIIIYQGMLMKGRGIIPVVESLKYNEDLVFCLLGLGDYDTAIKNKTIELGVSERVILCGNVKYEELHNWTCSADIANCFIEPISFSNELALPNKMFEYCMAGIPSLLSDLPAIKKINDEYKIGKLIPNNSNPEKIADAIKEILMEQNYKEYVENCGIASKVFNYESQEKTILNIFEENI